MDDADYDPAAAAPEWNKVSGRHVKFARCTDEFTGGNCVVTEHQDNKCLSPTAKYMVAVDGSRQSYLAFELAARLRRQGQLAVVNINEELAASRQLPHISGEFIAEEYKAHCARLQLPTNRVTITCEESAGTSSVAQQLLLVAERERVDFLVLGAHGKGGPAIDQVHHVPWEVLRCTTSIPTLVVPPAPLNSVISKQYVFVVAVDKSAAGTRCLNATLKLMRPVDTLRVVHFHEKPIVGEYDAQPFEWYRNVIEGAQINGEVDIQPIERTSIIAESLQAYVSANSAAYLVLGLNGDGAEAKSRADNPEDEQYASHSNETSRIGRLASAMLFSPRCALCLCP
ncbi:hypothetical protein ON010_g18036 [Phytophthora cinnamomi]|nr:hypothetical protein ON010_g18036 [Phytophthora cinnamomi]